VSTGPGRSSHCRPPSSSTCASPTPARSTRARASRLPIAIVVAHPAAGAPFPAPRDALHGHDPARAPRHRDRRHARHRFAGGHAAPRPSSATAGWAHRTRGLDERNKPPLSYLSPRLKCPAMGLRDPGKSSLNSKHARSPGSSGRWRWSPPARRSVRGSTTSFHGPHGRPDRRRRSRGALAAVLRRDQARYRLHAPRLLYQVAKMDGAIILTANAHQDQLGQRPAHAGSDDPLDGDRHAATARAERVSSRRNALVVAISQRREVVSLYVDGAKVHPRGNPGRARQGQPGARHARQVPLRASTRSRRASPRLSSRAARRSTTCSP